MLYSGHLRRETLPQCQITGKAFHRNGLPLRVNQAKTVSMSPEPENPAPSPQGKNKRQSRPELPQTPFWKNIVINLLRNISRFSETAAVKLETQQKAEWSVTTGTLEKLQLLFNGISNKISGVLPKNLPINLPTPAWIGIVGVTVAIALWITSSLFATKPPTQVASNTEPEIPIPQVKVTPTPSVEEIPEPEPTLMEEVAETPTSEVTSTPSTEEALEPEPTPTPIETPEPEVTSTPPIEEPETIATPEVIATPTPSVEETVEPEPTATKKIVLTPEESLIAAIENQIAEISDRIAPGLIHSIQADFRTSSLSIIIDDEWYSLPGSEQSELAAKMLQRSQELDFSHLEVLDSQKRLLARSPVVGNKMIIFTPVIKTDSIQ